MCCENSGKNRGTAFLADKSIHGDIFAKILIHKLNDVTELQIEYDAATAFPDNSDAPLHFYIDVRHFEIELHGKWQKVFRNKSLSIPHGGLLATIKTWLPSGLIPN